MLMTVNTKGRIWIRTRQINLNPYGSVYNQHCRYLIIPMHLMLRYWNGIIKLACGRLESRYRASLVDVSVHMWMFYGVDVL